MLTPCTLQKNCLNELSTCKSKIAKTVGLLNTYICLEDFRAKALVLLGILRNEEILN